MDNKKNPMTEALSKVMKYSNSFLTAAKSHIETEKSKLSPEEQKKVDDMMKEQGVNDKMQELEKSLAGFKEVIKNVNANMGKAKS